MEIDSDIAITEMERVGRKEERSPVKRRNNIKPLAQFEMITTREKKESISPKKPMVEVPTEIVGLKLSPKLKRLSPTKRSSLDKSPSLSLENSMELDFDESALEVRASPRRRRRSSGENNKIKEKSSKESPKKVSVKKAKVKEDDDYILFGDDADEMEWDGKKENKPMQVTPVIVASSKKEFTVSNYP